MNKIMAEFKFENSDDLLILDDLELLSTQPAQDNKSE
jgi:hypothetical protein